MWLFTVHGFFSCVRDKNGRIMVRARERGHLDRLKKRFKLSSPVIETPDADYRWRIVIAKATYVFLAGELAGEVDYGNFKSEVAAEHGYNQYEKSLHRVWSVMHELQREKHAPRSLWD